MKKLAAVVVLFNPDQEELFFNINSYAEGVDMLYVWDNTPGRPSVCLNESSNVTIKGTEIKGINGKCKYLHHQHQNMGLGYAYNRAIEEAKEIGCSHIMTMDQDSRFENFQLYKDSFEKNQKESDEMFCPPINTSDVIEDGMVSCAAQSGCIFSLEMIEKIGGFREDFFIGMVDVEMQLRAQNYGYMIRRIGGCNLVHQVGSSRVVTLFGHKIQVSDYNAVRHYYDSRNRILMWYEFPDDYNAKGKLKHFTGRLKVLVKIALFEKEKMKKISAIIRGTWNGIFKRMKTY